MKKTDTFGAHVVGTLINYFGKIMYTFGTVLNSLFEQRKPPSQAKFLFLGDSNTYDSTNNWTGYLIRDLMNITFAQVVPTREFLKIGKVPCQSLSQKDLLSLRKTLCRDNLCHLNPSANKVLADYIQKNVFKL